MPVFNTSARVGRGIYVSFGGTRIRGIGDISSFTPSGSVPQVDITTMDSTSREYLAGLADAGDVATTATLAMHSPIYKALKASADNGDEQTLRIIFGNIPSGRNFTDGTANTIASAKTITNAFTSGTHKATAAKAVADTIGAVTEGDIIVKTGTTTPVYNITDVSYGTAAGSVVFTTDASSDPSSALGTSVDILKPAVEIVYQAYVSGFDGSAAIDSAVTHNLTFKITGTPVLNVGAPNITI